MPDKIQLRLKIILVHSTKRIGFYISECLKGRRDECIMDIELSLTLPDVCSGSEFMWLDGSNLEGFVFQNSGIHFSSLYY